MNSCFIRNGFLAGVLIGIGCIANVVSNNAILGSFLFSLALLSICILQLKLCTGAFGYINNKENLKDCFVMLLSNIVGVSLICYIVANFSSICIDTSVIVNNKFNEVWYDALVRGIGCGILIYLAVECFKRYKHPLVVIIPVMGFIICGFDHCIANYGYMILNDFHWTNNMIYWVLGNAVGSLMISKIQRQKCLDDTREDEISQPYSLPSKQPDEDSMHLDHISCHRALSLVYVQNS